RLRLRCSARPWGGWIDGGVDIGLCIRRRHADDHRQNAQATDQNLLHQSSSLWKYGGKQRPREANVPAMPAKKTIQNEQLAARDNAPRRFIRQREPRPSVACKGRLSSGGVSGTPHARPGERLSRVPLGKETQWAGQRFLTERPAPRVRPYRTRSLQ